MRVLSVVGNRPQFVKSAPLSAAYRERGITEVMLHTGQHYDDELSRVFFDELGLPEPKYRLDLRTADPVAMRPRIRDVIERELPKWVVVLGDTNSTLAGAQAAREVHVALAHVEAGLRSGDLSMPEERNRIDVDRIAALLLCPDERSVATLAREGVVGRAEIVGDVMGDAVRVFEPIAKARSKVLAELDLTPGAYIVLTIHREANATPERLRAIAAELNTQTERVVFPAHPRTRHVLGDEIKLAPWVDVIEPLGYLDFAALASQARVIVTDSGGLQKEAYWYGVPCVTVRPSTEWVDTVEIGANRLVEPDGINAALATARMPAERPELYGDGYAAVRIADALSTLVPG